MYEYSKKNPQFFLQNGGDIYSFISQWWIKEILINSISLLLSNIRLLGSFSNE
jgi:hypothetical protein